MRTAHRPHHLSRAALAAALLILLTACHVDATVGLRVDEQGAGVVTARFTFDADAVRQLGGLNKPLAAQPRVGDLTRAGWKVSPVRTRSGGGAEVEATKRFTDVAGFGRVMNELSGPDGPFRNFRIQRRRDNLRTRTAFSGDVVLQGQETSLPGDADLKQRLQDQGVDANDLQTALQDAYAKYFTLRVAVVLPASASDNAPQHVGGQPVWVPKIGERLHLVATATSSNVRRPLIAFLVTGLAALVVVLVLLRFRRRSRARA